MIPLLVYLLRKKGITRLMTRGWLNMKQVMDNVLRFFFLNLAVLLLAFLPVLLKSQNQQLKYKIVQGGDTIGWLQLDKRSNGDSSSLSLVSEIKKRIFFLITVFAKESAVYKGGQLIASAQFRKTNNDTKLNKQTKFSSGRYEVIDDGEKQSLPYTFIGANLLSLYFKEPVGLAKVYCENYSAFIPITKTDDGGYKVKYTDGNSNCFYYSKGLCNKIVISHTFYSAQVLLTF